MAGFHGDSRELLHEVMQMKYLINWESYEINPSFSSGSGSLLTEKASSRGNDVTFPPLLGMRVGKGIPVPIPRAPWG